jgi:biopolymer transport protein TolQ
MPDASALTPDNFGVIATFLRADWVVKAVMIGLLFASLASWGIIIDKAFRFAALNRQADRFEDQVGSGRSLEEVAQATGESKQALPLMLQTALREWKDARAKGALSDTQTALLIQRIDRGLDSVIARETRRIEDGLGIMTAFQAIAIQKNTNLSVVAPAIAQALFATAIGLAAAVPAYIAYNKYSVDAAKFTARLEAFADDLAAAVTRRLGGS